MTIESIVQLPLAPVSNLDSVVTAAAAPAASGTNAVPDFGNVVGQGLAAVNQQLLSSETDMQKAAVGNDENLHHIMIRLEESRLSFQLLLQVRGRLLEAYQDVMKMQI
jgi:flagellar hook-basal body complex protein FliE